MEQNFLLACFIFLTAALIVVPFAKATGLGAVLGYLVAGIIIGPYALKLVTDPQTILHFSEFGVVMMLFLIGLELQPRELWNMRDRLLGLGASQVALTTGLFAAIALAVGMPWQSAIIAGLALALSSTAIVLQIMGERSIMQTDTGKSGFSVLLFQDIAVIPILALIPLLALPHLAGTNMTADHGASTTSDTAGWISAIQIFAIFAGMFLAGRYVLRPVMRFIAQTGIREIFTALALFLVVGAALLMEWLNLSHALGAFIVGVILADSEYRHELQSDLEPFKGLLLGLFFISVGMSIEFSVLFSEPLAILAMVLGLVIIKFAVLFMLATLFRLHLTDRILFAILLAQGGEFAFVLLQFAFGAGAIEKSLSDMLNVTVALSMTITPLLILVFDRLIIPRLTPAKSDPGIPDMADARKSVLILGYGRFGQIVARLLHAQGFETTLIDHDPAQIELARRFDLKVFYGDAARKDLLEAAGAAQARMIVVAVDDREKSNEICQLARRHFTQAKLFARAVNRVHAFELIDIGVDSYERETFRSALQLGTSALIGLGYGEHRAHRIAKAFERHDIEALKQSFELRGDDEAYVGYMRQSRDMLIKVMQSDRDQTTGENADSWRANSEHIDKEAKARSD